jgi:hypothetical protein
MEGIPMKHATREDFMNLEIATAGALGLFLVAIAKQVDAQKLCSDLSTELNEASSNETMPLPAIQLATIALGILYKELNMQNSSDKH